MNPLLVVGGALLLFFIPGYLLLSALFPRQRWFGPFHPVALPALSVFVSIVLLVFVGSILGFLPGGIGGKGWFQGSQTGMPILEAALVGISLVLVVVAWRRGAFPSWGGKAKPMGFEERGEPGDITLLRDLRLEEARLRTESRRVRRRAAESRDAGVRTALEEAAAGLERERARVVREARQVEERAARRRYG